MHRDLLLLMPDSQKHDRLEGETMQIVAGVPRQTQNPPIGFTLWHKHGNKRMYVERLMVSEQAREDGGSTPGGMMRGNDAHDEC